MTKIRITKKFDFEAGHALFGYDGKCKNIHGHSYKLFVTVIGEPNNQSPHKAIGEKLLLEGHNVIMVDYQPTSENLIIDFAHKIQAQLPKSISLFSLRLQETESSFAEWFASDNL